MQGLSEEIIRDAAAVDLDPFSKDRFPQPDNSAMELVTENHNEMSKIPYAAQAAEEEELLQQKLIQE